MEKIKNIQSEGIIEMKNLGRGTRSTDASITKRKQDSKEIIPSIEYRIQIKTKILNLKISLNKTCRKLEIMKRLNLIITGIERGNLNSFSWTFSRKYF